jgi:hypothetical protein
LNSLCKMELGFGWTVQSRVLGDRRSLEAVGQSRGRVTRTDLNSARPLRDPSWNHHNKPLPIVRTDRVQVSIPSRQTITEKSTDGYKIRADYFSRDQTQEYHRTRHKPNITSYSKLNEIDMYKYYMLYQLNTQYRDKTRRDARPPQVHRISIERMARSQIVNCCRR